LLFIVEFPLLWKILPSTAIIFRWDYSNACAKVSYLYKTMA